MATEQHFLFDDAQVEAAARLRDHVDVAGAQELHPRKGRHQSQRQPFGAVLLTTQVRSQVRAGVPIVRKVVMALQGDARDHGGGLLGACARFLERRGMTLLRPREPRPRVYERRLQVDDLEAQRASLHLVAPTLRVRVGAVRGALGRMGFAHVRDLSIAVDQVAIRLFCAGELLLQRPLERGALALEVAERLLGDAGPLEAERKVRDAHRDNVLARLCPLKRNVRERPAGLDGGEAGGRGGRHALAARAERVRVGRKGEDQHPRALGPRRHREGRVHRRA